MNSSLRKFAKTAVIFVAFNLITIPSRAAESKNNCLTTDFLAEKFIQKYGCIQTDDCFTPNETSTENTLWYHQLDYMNAGDSVCFINIKNNNGNVSYEYFYTETVEKYESIPTPPYAKKVFAQRVKEQHVNEGLSGTTRLNCLWKNPSSDDLYSQYDINSYGGQSSPDHLTYSYRDDRFYRWEQKMICLSTVGKFETETPLPPRLPRIIRNSIDDDSYEGWINNSWQPIINSWLDDLDIRDYENPSNPTAPEQTIEPYEKPQSQEGSTYTKPSEVINTPRPTTTQVTTNSRPQLYETLSDTPFYFRLRDNFTQ